MNKLKKLLRDLLLAFLILLAMSGVFFAVNPRRPDQDYDNEVKTELVEERDESMEKVDRN